MANQAKRNSPFRAFVFSTSNLFRISSFGFRISRASQALSFMQNEPNFRLFTPKNEDSEKKRTQTNPISPTCPASLLAHHGGKVVKEVVRVVWAWGRFGVVLDGEGFEAFGFQPFSRIVVEIQVGQFDVFTFERIDIDAKAVVLRGDLDSACFEIFDGMVRSSVSEFQFVSFPAERQAEYLMAEAYPKDGDFAKQGFDGIDSVCDRCRVAGAVAQEYAVWFVGEYLFGGCRSGDNLNGTAMRIQQAQDVVLDAVVYRDDFVL